MLRSVLLVLAAWLGLCFFGVLFSGSDFFHDLHGNKGVAIMKIFAIVLSVPIFAVAFMAALQKIGMWLMPDPHHTKEDFR